MPEPSHDPSIQHEPHLQPSPPPPPKPGDPLPYADPNLPSPTRDQNVWDEPHLAGAPHHACDDQVEHGVWDEGVTSSDLAGAAPPDVLTYARWYDDRRARSGPLRSWLLVLAVAVAAGPWAILGALFNSAQTVFGALAMVVFAPVVEELLKVALPLYLVEKRPYLLRSSLQIILCGLAGGAAFGVIENLIYLNVYIPDPSPGLVAWRWTVCTALHTTCSAIAAAGLARVWRRTATQRSRPELPLASPFLTAAMLLHGAYNATAVALELGGYKF